MQSTAMTTTATVHNNNNKKARRACLTVSFRGMEWNDDDDDEIQIKHAAFG